MFWVIDKSTTFEPDELVVYSVSIAECRVFVKASWTPVTLSRSTPTLSVLLVRLVGDGLSVTRLRVGLSVLYPSNIHECRSEVK